jgi:hypothetical protein
VHLRSARPREPGDLQLPCKMPYFGGSHGAIRGPGRKLGLVEQAELEQQGVSGPSALCHICGGSSYVYTTLSRYGSSRGLSMTWAAGMLEPWEHAIPFHGEAGPTSVPRDGGDGARPEAVGTEPDGTAIPPRRR